jgi:hypothetical protein
LGEPGQREAHAIASAFEATSIIQKPPSSSAPSIRGPSVTRGFPLSKLTRAPIERGCNPSSESSTPAFCRASLNFIISATAAASGTVPGAACS